jgi:large subunit ribosomal protein L1
MNLARWMNSFKARPLTHTQTRNYDRKRYLKEKRKLKKSTSLENISLSDHLNLFKKYTMKQEFDIICAIQLLDLTKPVRGVVSLPNAVGADTESKVLVFATGKDAEIAKELGATFVGGQELIQDVYGVY